jgi:hypothetical protein
LAVAYSSNQSGYLYSPLVSADYGNFPPVNYTSPQSKFVPQIQDSSGNAISFILSSASFTKSTGQILFTLDLCPAVQINPVVFKTPTFNIPLGFSVYFSMPFSGGRTTVTQKEAYLVGSVRYLYINSGWVTSNSLIFSIDTDPEYFSKCKYAFNVGHHIFVSVYAVSNCGQSAFVGRQLIFIS